ncbi:OPT/YSL family transporter [Candidatus Woesearchaeota archaeon]|nr:OPT/YSL family transporter [Candidatus Woesearchaeota archaeon]
MGGVKGFTSASIITAIIISLFLVITSSYIALKLGALPWPIIFSVVLSAGLVKLFSFGKSKSIHEVNVASAGGSVGGLMASALVFTLPGIILLQQHGSDIELPSKLTIFSIAITAGLLGIILSIPLRKKYVDKLPYPSGTAGATIMKESGGKYLPLLVLVGVITFTLTAGRDILSLSAIPVPFLEQYGIFFTILIMPMIIAVGYIIGAKGSLSWFSGSVVGWLLLIPALIFIQKISSDIASQTIQNAGMGIILGSGLGFFVSYFLPRYKEFFQAMEYKGYVIILITASAAIMISSGVPILAAAIAVISLLLMIPIAGRMTGETNIDPLEQFGIFTALFIGLIYGLLGLGIPTSALFLIVFFIAVACAVAGDVGHDFKSAKILGTDAKDIVKIDIIAIIVVAIALPFIFDQVIGLFGSELFTPSMPAPQAQVVAAAIGGLTSTIAFIIGVLVALMYEIFFKKKNLMMIPFGIGMFLGLSLSSLLLIGGLIALWVEKKRKKWFYPGIIIGTAIMAGEGLSGYSMAFMKSLNINVNFFILLAGAIIFLILFFSVIKKGSGKLN